MNKKLITVLLVLSSFNVFGQIVEYSIQINSGFFKFSGNSAENIEQINFNLNNEDGYTNNPYGSEFGLSYGISTSLIKTTKTNLRFGIDLGYEMLRSKIEIDGVWQNNGSASVKISATGKTNLNSSFINLFPRFGYQISNPIYNLYFDGGFDFAYCLASTEIGYAQSETREYETKRDRKTIDFDVRPRIQIGMTRNRFGGYVGYSKGLINYKSGFAGGTNEAYSELVRIGLTYKL